MRTLLAKVIATMFIYMICMVISLRPIHASCGYHGVPSLTPPVTGGCCYNDPPEGECGKACNPGNNPCVPGSPGGYPGVPSLVPPVTGGCCYNNPLEGDCGKACNPDNNPGAPGSPGCCCYSPPKGGCGEGCRGGGGGSPSPPITQDTCPINALKLGLCLDVLGGLVHIGIGDPTKQVCCPVLQGLLELEAALCLCLAIRIKLLNINIFIPLGLTVLAQCGINPPPGFTCPN